MPVQCWTAEKSTPMTRSRRSVSARVAGSPMPQPRSATVAPAGSRPASSAAQPA
ncbi:MAG TPA: hypothetical protein VFO01_10805 [Trebonia sp.]|nr:hypothetical protein [Trebonia sp.]